MKTRKYVAGKCNIGNEDVKKKKNFTVFWFAVTLFVIVLLFENDVERIWRLLIFFPSNFFIVYFQQWIYEFSTGFGIKGVCNFGKLGEREKISSEEDRKKDFVKAWQIYYSGFFLALGITSVVYYWG